jgi:hypothetical protein
MLFRDKWFHATAINGTDEFTLLAVLQPQAARLRPFRADRLVAPQPVSAIRRTISTAAADLSCLAASRSSRSGIRYSTSDSRDRYHGSDGMLCTINFPLSGTEHSADGRGRIQRHIIPLLGDDELPSVGLTSCRSCFVPKEGIHHEHSISRCALLNVPAGSFSKDIDEANWFA